MMAPNRPTTRERHAATRAFRRAAESGSGPVADGATTAPFAGFVNGFGLLGEVLLIGVVIAVVAVPVVSLPAALVAGIGHLRRYVGAEGCGAAAFWRDLRAAFWGGVGVAVVALLFVAAAL